MIAADNRSTPRPVQRRTGEGMSTKPGQNRPVQTGPSQTVSAPGAEPERPAELRRRVDELVSRVPRHAIRAVIDEIDNASAPNGERAAHLRDALVEHFNRLRPMKARRLFTSLFEPFLIDDPVLFRAREAVPGLIQRVDMGGIWQALARFAFPTLAMEVQDRLDALSRDAILDHVLAGPEAMDMRDAMRAEAAGFLARLPRDRRMAEPFLLLANREALKDARQRTPHLAAKATIDLRALSFVQAVLQDNDALLPLAERMRRDLSDTPATGGRRDVEIDGQAAVLVGFGRDLRLAGPGRGSDDPVLWLGPLFALNVKRRYDVVLRYLREYGAPVAPGDSHPLHDALYGHFTACGTTLIELIRATFGDFPAADGHVLALHKPVRALLTDAAVRFDASLTALAGGGFLSNRLIGPRIRSMLAEVGRLLAVVVLPVAVERAQAALNARHRPAPDHDDLLWLLGFVWRWGAVLGSYGYANPELQSLRARLLDDGHIAFLNAVKLDDENLTARMDHLVRINRVLGTVGDSVGPWVSPVSQGLHRVVEHHLDMVEEIDPGARFVIDGFIEAVRRELGRSRNWQSADLVAILRLYESRGW